MKTMLEAAKAAKFSVTALTTDQKNAALEAMAQALLDNQEAILAANATDIENATGGAICWQIAFARVAICS